MDFEYLVGTPYDDEHECKWLVRLITKEGKGVELPPNLIGWRRYGELIDWPTEIQPFDLIFFSNNDSGIVEHVGIAISTTDFMHASRIHGGVVCEPIRKYSARIEAVGRLK